MKDIVRVFEDYAAAQGWEYRYGSHAHINLLTGEIDPTKVHLLLFPPDRLGIRNNLGTATRGHNFKGRFFLVVAADYDLHYFNENGSSQTDSKYTTNVEPLLQIHDDMFTALACGDIEIDTWGCKDAIDVLDANKDGIWCNYSINVLK